ncbi:MAG: hypothetical protein ACSHXF_11295 [Aquaticitalea sp.]
MGILSFFGFKNRTTETKIDSMSFEEQVRVFESLGYEFADGVTKDLILTDGYAEQSWDIARKETLKHIEDKPFSRLYFYYGWRNPKIPGLNFSDKCIWFDIEFMDSPEQYIWFMKRMGVITDGEIEYSDISIKVDDQNYEWIKFKVNGIDKKWKLEKVGYIADTFFKRFSYLSSELNTHGKYTYYDDGGQQFVIDYATESEQKEFNKKTGLNREWLDEGNHFNEPE